MSDNYLTKLFINEAKPALNRHSGGGSKPPVVEALSVTENGTYTPPEGVDGYAPVEVDVPPAVVDSPIVLDNAMYFFYRDSRHNLLSRVDTSNCNNFDSTFTSAKITEITDDMLNFSKGHYFRNTFNSCYSLTKVDITTAAQLPVGANANYDDMFNACYKLKTISPKVNLNLSPNLNRTFSECRVLEEISIFDVEVERKELKSTFAECKSLKTIRNLNMNKSSTTSYVYNTFNNCAALENLYIYNIRVSLKIGSGTSWGHLLTVDSLVHTIKELCTVTSTQTLTMGSANTAKIADLYCKIIDDTDEKKPMELCESTDEGAMTLTDYALYKGWTIN